MLYLDSENLILNPAALRAQKNARLTQLKAFFRKYYGFIGSRDIAEALSLQQAIGRADRQPPPPPGVRSRTTPDTTSTRNNRTPTNAADVQAAIGDLNVRADPALVPIFEILMEGDSTVAKTILTNDAEAIRNKLNDLVTGTPTSPATPADQQQQLANISRCIKIHYCRDAKNDSALEQNQICFLDLDNAVPILASEGDSSEIKRRIAVVRMDHPLLMPGEKNAELLSVFFNGIPTLELTRATPVLNIKFFSTRQTLEGNKLSAITLQKFVEGARDIGEKTQSNVALHAFAKSNQIPTSSVNGNRSSVVDFNTYTVTGLELFRMPQSLQNIEGYKQTDNYLAPIIDPFRPLASIKSFSVDVKSAYGLQGTRTATLEIVLHDRSRMAEFADFVKPDRFGETFLEVEYGWLHPDLARDQNPYADLLNLTRSVEHFTIVTSNFNFDEVGQVNITLNLIGRGTAESTELSIVGETAASRIQTQIRQIEKLSETINRLSGVVFPNQAQSSENSTHRREIRGIQGLSAAGDATNNLILSRDVIRELNRLNATLNQRSASPALRPAANQLKTAIQDLVGVRENSNAPGENSRLAAVSQTLNLEIRTILNSLNDGPDKTNKNRFYNDSFLRTMPVWNDIKDNLARDRPQPTQSRDATPRQQLPSTGNNNASALPPDQRLPGWSGAKVVSLGTLLTAFVAKPLAALKNSDNTLKFKEVQMYFYNFNNKASWMSHCNISQFPVQTDYFTREYGRMRMESVSRTVNLSVNEFLSFVASRIVDDVINPAYGISDLYKINEEQQAVAKSERSFERDMETRMRNQNIGHHPDFVPPQVTFEIEATPSTEVDATTGNSQTVLKIHVFDKACSPNNPYRELLNLATENVLGTLSAYPGDPPQRTANEDLAIQNANAGTEEERANVRNELRQNWRQLHNAVVEDVRRLGLIAPINSAEGQQSETANQYRFSGGPQQLKEYIMKGMPHIIYGAMATTIKNATLGSQSDPALNTINIQRSLNASPVQPNGQQPGGVPLSVYPVELNMTSLGCPILRYGQEIFVDYNTNTSIDNIYYITGLQHKIEAGSFETTIKFTAVDAFGRYRNLISQLNTAAQTIAAIPQGQPQPPATPTHHRSHRSHTPRR